MTKADFMQEIGVLVLGSRLKRLSDMFMQDVKRFYSDHNVPFEPRWFPLYSLVMHSPDISLIEGASRLGLTHSAISQLASQMVEAGLLSYSKCADDERAKRLRLTAEGEALKPRLEPIWAALRNAVSDLLHETEVDILHGLDRIEQGLERQSYYDRVVATANRTVRNEVEMIPYQAGNKEHKDAFIQITRQWLEKHFSVEAEDERMLNNPEGAILAHDGIILLAKLQDKIVGVGCVYRHNDDEYEIAKMGVDEAYLGKGIGKKLMLSLIDTAQRKGAKKLFLMSNTVLIPAINLYRSLGFVERPRGDDTRYARCNIVMELTLAQSTKATPSIRRVG